MAIRGVPVFDTQGVLIQWVGTCTDIEDEKRLEDHLLRTQQTAAESLTLLETLQASAPVGFGYVDRDFRIVRLNDSLAAVNGSTVELQLGHTVAEVIPDLWTQIEPAYRKVLDTGNPVVNLEVTAEAPFSQSRSIRGCRAFIPFGCAGRSSASASLWSTSPSVDKRKNSGRL